MEKLTYEKVHFLQQPTANYKLRLNVLKKKQ
jgi:hypothetical protein